MNTSAMEKLDPARLGFDFDGVIADTADTFLRLACEKYNRCDIRLEDITNFTVEECLDMEASVVQSIFMEILVDSVGTGLRPMPGAVEVLSELTLMAPVTVVTARPAPEPVQQWMMTMLPAAVSKKIRIVAMGAHDDKPRHILDQGLTHFIDDRAETCLQLSSAGITPIVFTQPWNRDRHNLSSVDSWQEIRRLCL